MARGEFLVGVDAPQFKNGVSDGRLDQYGEVASRNHLDERLADGQTQYVLVQRFGGNAFVVGVRGILAHQMHDQPQSHVAAHGCFAKYGANIQQADAAYFEQVAQQSGAAAFDAVLVDAVQVHDVIGHQTVAA